MKKTLLLTGGTGFIGQNICASFLAQKYHLLAPTHEELDLTDPTALDRYLARHRPQLLLHTACKPGHRGAADLSGILQENLRMFLNLYRHGDDFEKFLFVGSGAAYDQSRPLTCVGEDAALNALPMDELGLYKNTCSRLIEHKPNMVDLRVFGLFGPGEEYAIRFISNAICKTLFNLPITLKQNRLFDYVWIEDFIKIADYFLDNPSLHRAYNITTGQPVELLYLAQRIKQLSAKDVPILVKKEGMGLPYSGDNARLLTQCNLLAFTPIEDAIHKLYAYYHARKDTLNKDLLFTDK